MQFRCPNCHNPIQIAVSDQDRTVELLSCPSCNSKISFATEETETVTPGRGMMIAHYEIRQVLGHGSFGTVYEAWDTELERKVAIKVPHQTHNSQEMNRTFLREAQAAASITHPNVVAVYELGQHNESIYIASEFIDGIELSDFLQQKTAGPDDYAIMMIKLLRAVHVFHENGVIHRDLKPSNILIDQTGEPHITDFGLARRETAHEVTVTQSGKIIGTPAFMPPEQARGESSAITSLSDVYSMGVILYAMLAGKRPFQASDTRTLLYTIMTAEPTPPRKVNASIHRDLETICLKAMAKAPGQRYQSAGEFADDLQRHLDGRPILARPVSLAEKAWKRMRRSPVVSSLLGLTASLLGALIYLSGQSAPLSPEETPQTVQVSVQSANGSSIDADTEVTWAFGMLDELTREPIADTVLTVAGGPKLQVELLPGEYLVVVEVSGLGFHEVYRTVPLDPASTDLQPIHPHRRWIYDAKSDTTLLPAVTIRQRSDVTSGMVRVREGDFVMGDGSKMRPRHPRHINEFYVDAREVSIEEFEADGIQTVSTDYPGNFAVSDLSWHGAVAWAERHGKRLLTEAEFEYLATNLGQADYPAGQGNPYSEEVWPYGPAGEPADDCIPELKIFGIHSNVAEWTSSTQSPYPGAEYFGHLRQKTIEQRVIRGGPCTTGDNDRSRNSWDQSVRYRHSRHAADFFDDEVGFRCGCSMRPGLIKSQQR